MFEIQSAFQDCSYEARSAARDRPARLEDFLNPAEYAVINMTREDSARWAKSGGVLTRLMHKLIGIAEPAPLNRRLEILRKFAIAAWFRDEIPTRHLRAMFSVGFDSNDVARIITHVAAIRGVSPEVEAWP